MHSYYYALTNPAKTKWLNPAELEPQLSLCLRMLLQTPNCWSRLACRYFTSLLQIMYTNMTLYIYIHTYIYALADTLFQVLYILVDEHDSDRQHLYNRRLSKVCILKSRLNYVYIWQCFFCFYMNSFRSPCWLCQVPFNTWLSCMIWCWFWSDRLQATTERSFCLQWLLLSFMMVKSWWGNSVSQHQGCQPWWFPFVIYQTSGWESDLF